MKNLIIIFLLFASVLFAQTIKLTPVDTLYPDSTRGERFVTALASLGDINKDGYDDFAVGYAEHSNSTDQDVSVVIYYGNESFDFSHTLRLFFKDTPDDIYKNNSPITTIENIGDINSDGWDDIALGMPHWVDREDRGRVFLFFGGNPMDSIVDWAMSDTSFITGHAFGQNIVGVGDWNSDGYDDFAISAHHQSWGGPALGQMYLIFGSEFPDTESFLWWEGILDGGRLGNVLASVDLEGNGTKELYTADKPYCSPYSIYPYRDSIPRLYRQNVSSRDTLLSIDLLNGIAAHASLNLSKIDIHNDEKEILFYRLANYYSPRYAEYNTYELFEIKHTDSLECNKIDLWSKFDLPDSMPPMTSNIISIEDQNDDSIRDVVLVMGEAPMQGEVYNIKIYILDAMDDYEVLYDYLLLDFQNSNWLYMYGKIVSLDFNGDGYSELLYFGSCKEIYIFTLGEYHKIIENTKVKNSSSYFSLFYNNTLHFNSIINQKALINVYDISGKKVISKEIYVRKGNNDVVLEDLSQGLFLYKIVLNNTDDILKGKIIIIN